MSGNRLTRSERRARILTAAAHVFAAGYDKAGMREIAAAAGITTPVLYDHFPAKSAIYADLLATQTDELIAGWAELPEDGGTGERLHARVEAIFTWIEHHDAGWRMIFGEPPADPAVAAVHAEGRRRSTERIATVLAGARALRLSAPMPRALADQALAEASVSALNAVAGWWLRHRDVPREQVVALTTDLLWRGLGSLIEEDV